MYANKEVEKKIKKISILDELLLILGKGKIMFKATDDTKHLTLSFLKEGILDVHETLEGREKRHIPLEKFDLKKFVGIKKTIVEETIHNLKEIDITDPKYMDAEVFVIEEEAFRARIQKVTKIEGRKVILEENKLMDVMKDFILPIRNLHNYDFKAGYLLEQSGEVSLLFRTKEKYLLINFRDLDALINKIFEKFKTRAREQNRP